MREQRFFFSAPPLLPFLRVEGFRLSHEPLSGADC
jgi:hypothetical protein